MNTTATIKLPVYNENNISVNGKAAKSLNKTSDGILLESIEDGIAVFSAESGNFYFESRMEDTVKIEINSYPSLSDFKVSINDGTPKALPTTAFVQKGNSVALKVVQAQESTNRFLRWTGDVVSADSVLTFTAAKDMNLNLILAEMYTAETKPQIELKPSDSLAVNAAAVTMDENRTGLPTWKLEFLTDGQLFTLEKNGATTVDLGTRNLETNPLNITINFGQPTTFDQIRMEPRLDVFVAGTGDAANFPVSYDIQVSDDGITYSTVHSVRNQTPPNASDKNIMTIVDFEPQTAQYLRIAVYKLSGRPGADTIFRMQISEIGVFNQHATKSLAINKSVTCNNLFTPNSTWDLAYINDGLVKSRPDKLGTTSNNMGTTTFTNPVIFTVDLKEAERFNQVILYPRSDVYQLNGLAGNFPVSYKIQVSNDGTNYSTVYEVQNQTPPSLKSGSKNICTICNFDMQRARYVRLVVNAISDPPGTESKNYLQLAELGVHFNPSGEEELQYYLEKSVNPEYYENGSAYSEALQEIERFIQNGEGSGNPDTLISNLLNAESQLGNYVKYPTITDYLANGKYGDADVLRIAAPEDLYEMSQSGRTFQGKKLLLTNDIDLTNGSLVPIGTSSSPFKGNLDGQGYVIRNFRITSNQSGCGLFGVTQNATIKDLTIENAAVEGTTKIGTLIGEAQKTTVRNVAVKNCSVNSTLTTGSTIDTGGFVGAAISSSFINCHVIDTECHAYRDLGGFIGASAQDNSSTTQGNTFINCYVIGKSLEVTGNSTAGFAGNGMQILPLKR